MDVKLAKETMKTLYSCIKNRILEDEDLMEITKIMLNRVNKLLGGGEDESIGGMEGQ